MDEKELNELKKQADPCTEDDPKAQFELGIYFRNQEKHEEHTDWIHWIRLAAEADGSKEAMKELSSWQEEQLLQDGRREQIKEADKKYDVWLRKNKYPNSSELISCRYLRRWLHRKGFKYFRLEYEQDTNKQPPDFWLTLANRTRYAVEVTELHSMAEIGEDGKEDSIQGKTQKVSKVVEGWEKKLRKKGYTGLYQILFRGEYKLSKSLKEVPPNLEEYLRFTQNEPSAPGGLLGFHDCVIQKFRSKEGIDQKELILAPGFIEGPSFGHGDLPETFCSRLKNKAKKLSSKKDIPSDSWVLVLLNLHEKALYPPHSEALSEALKEEEMLQFHSVFLLNKPAFGGLKPLKDGFSCISN